MSFKTVMDVRPENVSNVRAEAKQDTDKYESNNQKVEEIKIKNND